MKTRTNIMLAVAWVQEDSQGRPETCRDLYSVVSASADATGLASVFIAVDGQLLTVEQARDSGMWGAEPQLSLVPRRPLADYWLAECQERQEALEQAAEAAYERRRLADPAPSTQNLWN
jgi:hypothetical protein